MTLQETGASGLTAEEEQTLLRLAHAALAAAVCDERTLQYDLAALTPALRRPQATFVTLANNGALRGCVGHIFAEQPLYLDVIVNTAAAATRDYRFPPVTPSELPFIALSISLLTPPAPLAAEPNEAPAILGARKDGVVFEMNGFRSVLLPEVWEALPDPERFLDTLCLKAGLPAGSWRDPRARLLTFQTTAVSDPSFRLERSADA